MTYHLADDDHESIADVERRRQRQAAMFRERILELERELAALQSSNTLHRVNGYDATVACLQASLDVRDGAWLNGAPSHVIPEFLAALERRGFYLGVPSLSERA